ncbi:hypothetical protein [Candidatus Sodalis pierantonius]|uniref:hypothetical protein n=1 Tax=Candidatus Sodalis pierantonii TaxID=1486991 RepID=UPI0011DD76A3|nr:hypothetical protein [Candidatus Sodalis pierantonius]
MSPEQLIGYVGICKSPNLYDFTTRCYGISPSRYMKHGGEMSSSSKLADFPQTLRINQEWRRFCLIQALEYRRLGMHEAKK